MRCRSPSYGGFGSIGGIGLVFSADKLFPIRRSPPSVAFVPALMVRRVELEQATTWLSNDKGTSLRLGTCEYYITG